MGKRGRQPKILCSFHGEYLPAAEIATRFNLPHATVSARAKRGLTDDALIQIPIGPGAKKGSVTRPTKCYGEYYGEKLSARALAQMSGLKTKTILERIRNGRKDDELTAPLQDIRVNAAKARAKRWAEKEAKAIELPIGFRPAAD